MDNRPLYILPSGDPLIREWKEIFLLFENGQQELALTVEPSIVKEGDVGMLQQMILALQHYHETIEKMVFAVRFDFMFMDGLNMKMKELEWKSKKEIYNWFYKMTNVPVVPFFLKDSDCRFYCFMGDLMYKGVIKAKQEPGSKYFSLMPDQKQMQQMADRVFLSCWAFFMYCHNTGFEPDKYIDALIAELDMPFSLEHVRDKYLEDVEKGIEFRARTS